MGSCLLRVALFFVQLPWYEMILFISGSVLCPWMDHLPLTLLLFTYQVGGWFEPTYSDCTHAYNTLLSGVCFFQDLTIFCAPLPNFGYSFPIQASHGQAISCTAVYHTPFHFIIQPCFAKYFLIYFWDAIFLLTFAFHYFCTPKDIFDFWIVSQNVITINYQNT